MQQKSISFPGGKTELKIDGSGTCMKESGIAITPIAGFAIKTKKLKDELKFFINVCYHETIDKPGQKKKLDNEGNEVEGLNLPLSVGPIRTSLDRAGNVCLVVDAVVHPSVKADIIDDRSGSHRDFICLLLIQCVEQKYSEKNGPLDRKYKLPCLNYFGYVDKETGLGVPRASENAEICQQVVRDTSIQPKIEEVVISSTKTYSPMVLSKETTQLDIQIHIRLANGEEIAINDFIGRAKETLKRSEKNDVLDIIDSSTLEHSETRCMTESSNQSLPFLINSEISDNLAAESVICRSTLSNIDVKTIEVEVSSYSILISGPTVAQTEKIFPFCVLPHSCECIFNEEMSSFELSALVSSIRMEDSSDIGSQPWLFDTALSSEEANVERDVKNNKMEEQDNESRLSLESDTNIIDDIYQVRPGRIWKKTSSNLQPITQKSTTIDSLPEDDFHSNDVVSRHLIQQQEEEREDKKNQVEKRRKESEKDDSVEYLSPDDFKPGGKYYEGENDTSDKTNNINRDESQTHSLEAAERVLQNNVVNPFRNNFWLQLM